MNKNNLLIAFVLGSLSLFAYANFAGAQYGAGSIGSGTSVGGGSINSGASVGGNQSTGGNPSTTGYCSTGGFGSIGAPGVSAVGSNCGGSGEGSSTSGGGSFLGGGTAAGTTNTPSSGSGTSVALQPMTTYLIDTNLGFASWTVTLPDGAGTTSGSGDRQFAHVSVGEASIVFKDAYGYTTPPSQSAYVTGGGTVVFTGNYTLLGPTARIEINGSTSDLIAPKSFSDNYSSDIFRLFVAVENIKDSDICYVTRKRAGESSYSSSHTDCFYYNASGPRTMYQSTERLTKGWNYYKVVAENPAGITEDEIGVFVPAPPEVTLTVNGYDYTYNPQRIAFNESFTLKATGTNSPTSCYMAKEKNIPITPSYSSYVCSTYSGTNGAVVTPESLGLSLGYNYIYVYMSNIDGDSEPRYVRIDVTDPVCSNGATNYPTCNTCPSGKFLVSGSCVTPDVSATTPLGVNLGSPVDFYYTPYNFGVDPECRILDYRYGLLNPLTYPLSEYKYITPVSGFTTQRYAPDPQLAPGDYAFFIECQNPTRTELHDVSSSIQVTVCAAGQEWNASSRVCITPATCGDGYERQLSTNTCVAVCPSGTSWDVPGGVCYSEWEVVDTGACRTQNKTSSYYSGWTYYSYTDTVDMSGPGLKNVSVKCPSGKTCRGTGIPKYPLASLYAQTPPVKFPSSYYPSVGFLPQPWRSTVTTGLFTKKVECTVSVNPYWSNVGTGSCGCNGKRTDTRTCIGGTDAECVAATGESSSIINICTDIPTTCIVSDCGNGTCDVGESPATCPKDCKIKIQQF